MTVEFTKSETGEKIVTETIFTYHIAADNDGALKINKIEEFHDPEAFLKVRQAFSARG